MQPPGWGAPPPQQPPSGWPGHPGPGQPGPGGQWGPPQQPWPAPTPPKKRGAGKWIIGAVALVAVIAVTVAVTVSVMKNGGVGSSDGGTPVAPSDVASANDKGPVGIMTEDPSCAPWTPINNTLYDVQNHGWSQRDQAAPSSTWTPELRAQFEAVGKGFRNAADQAVPLAKMTTHRVMRELYTQFIVYSRAYADRIAVYEPKDDQLARAASTASLVILYVCSAIESGSAAARAALVPPQAAPESTAPVGDLSNPKRLFDSPDPVCADLSPTLQVLLQNSKFKIWVQGDPKVSVGNMTPEQRATADEVAQVMSGTASALEQLAAKTSNPIVRDFILLGVQYRRTFVKSMPTYQPNDQNVYLAGQYAPGVVSMACNYAM